MNSLPSIEIESRFNLHVTLFFQLVRLKADVLVSLASVVVIGGI